MKLGFIDVLTLLLAALKLLGKVDLSWFQVFIPMIAFYGAVAVFVLLVVVLKVCFGGK